MLAALLGRLALVGGESAVAAEAGAGAGIGAGAGAEAAGSSFSSSAAKGLFRFSAQTGPQFSQPTSQNTDKTNFLDGIKGQSQSMQAVY